MRPAVRSFFGALCLGLCLGACGDNRAGPPVADAGPDAAPGQGVAARGELAINEVAPRPESGPDWIELINRSDQSIDLCDYFVSDSLDRLDHYLPLGGAASPDPCDPAPLEPGQRLVITCDDDVAAGPDHAPFKLGADDQVHVIRYDGVAVDSLIYLVRSPDTASLARRPDGEGLFFPATPTPGEANR